MTYERTMDRVARAVDELRGREFTIKTLVDKVNTKDDGTMRSNGTVNSAQATRLAMGQRLIVPCGKKGCVNLWRAA